MVHGREHDGLFDVRVTPLAPSTPLAPLAPREPLS